MAGSCALHTLLHHSDCMIVMQWPCSAVQRSGVMQGLSCRATFIDTEQQDEKQLGGEVLTSHLVILILCYLLGREL